MTELSIFLVSVVALLATPGPTNTLLATSGALSGWRKSLILLAAELVGYLTSIGILRLVLGPLVHGVPWLAAGLKLAVAIYLVWMAVRLWQSGKSGFVDADRPVSFRAVLVTTLLNPKGLIFAFTIFPADDQLFWTYVPAFALTVPLIGFGWVLSGAAVGATAGRGRAGVIRRIASVVLFGFAGLLAASALG